MTDRERAIAYIEEHRENHLAWIARWRDYPPVTREDFALREGVGGIDHHDRCVRRYDLVLRVLRGEA